MPPETMEGAQHPEFGKQVAAYCDVDGTLAHTDIVGPLIYLKQHLEPGLKSWLWMCGLLWRGPWWLLLDRCSRAASNRSIYAHYRGMPVARVRELAGNCYRKKIRSRLYQKALEYLDRFRSDGVLLVLVTGGLDLFMEPLARELGADYIAPKLEEVDGIFTGRLVPGPLTGEAKAEAVRRHAEAHGVDLARSFAMGDAFGDKPMLECVGRPVAINPDRRLLKVAVARGWQVERW